MTPPEVVRIGHVVLAVRDLEASAAFYVDLLGLHVLHAEPHALYLRAVEDREWSLKLERAEAPCLRQIGFKVGSDAAIDALAALAQAHGLPSRVEHERDRPVLLRMQDPTGLPLAFYYQSLRHPWLLQRYDLHRGPGLVRLDHVNVFSPDVESTMRWYTRALGFRLTEYTLDGDGRWWAAWMHRKGNVHDMAVTAGTGPRLHHFAYWMPDGARILQLCDILGGARRESHIERGPGRHGISNACYLYLRDPDGHRIELYTSDYLTVDPDFEPIRWQRDDPRRQQLWGGIAPRSWFTEGSVVEAFEGGPHAATDPAMVGLPDYVS